MKTMRTLAKLKPEKGIWMDEVPIPEIGPNDVLIKIKKTAICGTDIHIYNWDAWSQNTIPVPMAVGHEFAGVIEKAGSEVVGLKEGDRVSGEGHLTCGHCRNCRAGKRHLCRNTIGVGVNRPGCFAQYLSIPAVNVFPLPDSISNEIGSLLDPLGNATQITYDPTTGNPASRTVSPGGGDPDRTTSYTYDAVGRVATESDPLGNTWMYSYRPDDQRETATDPAGKDPIIASVA